MTPFHDAAECLADALQRLVPPGWRGLRRIDAVGIAGVGRGEAVQLSLGRDVFLERAFDLPPNGAARPEWIAARIEDLSPWDPGAGLWATRRSGGRLWLAVLPLRPVAEAEAAVAVRGARLAEVVAEGYRFRADTGQLRRWRDRLMLAAGLSVAVAGGAAWIAWQVGSDAMTRADEAAATIVRSNARLAAGAGPANAAMVLLQRKSASLGVALAHLAKALPDDSYATLLTITPESVEIAGFTRRPEAIVPALAADALFDGVNFSGPTAHDAESGSYSFEIRSRLKVP